MQIVERKRQQITSKSAINFMSMREEYSYLKPETLLLGALREHIGC